MNDKFQNPKVKINPNVKCLISKPDICYLSFVLWHSFVICALVFGIYTNAYALNVDKMKVCILSGDYDASIKEGERMLAGISVKSENLDELYYLLGLSYLKDENYLRSSDIFEIILKEFKDSHFRDEAALGLADTYLLRGDIKKAEGIYKGLLGNNPSTRLKAQVYYRLSQIGLKKEDTSQAREYAAYLKQEFPLNLESRLNTDLSSLISSNSDLFYSVQVGSFSNSVNARNLVQKLKDKGYPVYLEEANSPAGDKIYRVRVGKFKTRQEVLDIKERLSQEGYPTKVCP